MNYYPKMSKFSAWEVNAIPITHDIISLPGLVSEHPTPSLSRKILAIKSSKLTPSFVELMPSACSIFCYEK